MNNNKLNNFSDLRKLFNVFPPDIQQILEDHKNKGEVLEVILDLGKRAEARFLGKTEYISKRNISWQDLDYTVRRVGKFNDDNRAGIEKTLHRISCICNREGLIVGLTCRVGRSISGPISLIRDYLQEEKSFLILGKPGVGKTTIIREMARVLSDELQKRVVIIDTSNEIAGASNIPHSSLGRARRMQVKKSKLQHDIMLEAVENHMPQVIIIDEISTELEVLAARTIAERGVQLIGTVHGTTLKNLVQNPILVELIGGLQYVTLSDDEAKRRDSQKSILERKTNSSFEIAIEILERHFWTIHSDVEKSMDLILKNKENFQQIRNRKFVNHLLIQMGEGLFPIYQNKKFEILKKTWNPNFSLNFSNFLPLTEDQNWYLAKENLNFIVKQKIVNQKKIKIYCYGFSPNYFEIINLSNFVNYSLTDEIEKANLIITTKDYLKKNSFLIPILKNFKKPIYAFNGINVQEIANFLKTIVYLLLIKD